MAKTHYLEKDRLANVIAAIQILGVSDRASATLDRWVAELETAEEMNADQLELMSVKFADRKKWSAVFEQHPEFFKSYTLRGEQRVLLRMRYAQSFTPAGKKNGTNGANGNGQHAEPRKESNHPPIESVPLTADQIQMLVNTAIELHAKESAAERKPERLSPFVMAAAGAALGTVAGGTAIVVLGWMQSAPMMRLFD
jgi:hypothetical protein